MPENIDPYYALAAAREQAQWEDSRKRSQATSDPKQPQGGSAAKPLAKLVQAVPGGDWFDPATVVRVRASDSLHEWKPEVIVVFKDGDWTSDWIFLCETIEEARELRGRIATLRNESC